jgi:hypothetical protein
VSSVQEIGSQANSCFIPSQKFSLLLTDSFPTWFFLLCLWTINKKLK